MADTRTMAPIAPSTQPRILSEHCSYETRRTKLRFSSTPAPVKAVELRCVTCGGANLTKTVQPLMATFIGDKISDVEKHAKPRSKPAIPNGKFELNIFSKCVTANNSLLLSVLELSCNQDCYRKPKGRILKGITTRDTEDVQPPVVQIPSRNPVLEPIDAPVVAPRESVHLEQVTQEKLGDPANLGKPSLPDLTPTCIDTQNLLIDQFLNSMECAKDISVKVGDFTFQPDFVVVDFEQTPESFNSRRFEISPANYTHMTAKQDWTSLIWHVSNTLKKFLVFTDIIASALPTPKKRLFPGQEDDPRGIRLSAYNPFYNDPEGDILILEADCHPHLEYAFFEGRQEVARHFAKEMDVEEKIRSLVKVLKSHKSEALAWNFPEHSGYQPGILYPQDSLMRRRLCTSGPTSKKSKIQKSTLLLKRMLTKLLES
ncbi:hypothetical protein Tco_0378099 [Tanacetum coccineum]